MASDPSTYFATIRHPSISRARDIDCGNNLDAAKKIATTEFEQEQRDYEITIYEQRPYMAPEICSTRKVSNRKWLDR
jgi:hypothetical protein